MNHCKYVFIKPVVLVSNSNLNQKYDVSSFTMEELTFLTSTSLRVDWTGLQDQSQAPGQRGLKTTLKFLLALVWSQSTSRLVSNNNHR